MAPIILCTATNSYKINILDKNPVNGGIPAIEKNTKIKENAHKLLFLNKLDKLDKNNALDSFE